MRTFDLPGGWYCDAMPDGRWAAAIFEGRAVEGSSGRFVLDKDLLYLRVGSRGNELKFAGQDIAGGGNFEGMPLERVGDSFGVNPVIYLANGALVQAAGSHQGWRYVDASGAPVTGDASRTDGVFSEYTDLGDGIRVGQFDDGHTMGCGIRVGAEPPRLLASGEAFFIRAKREGDSVSVAFWSTKPARSRFAFFTVAEIAQFPFIVPVATPPLPVPTPEPKPMPETPTIPAAELDRLRAQITIHPLAAGVPDLPWTIHTALELGGRWGLNGKRGDAKNPSHDILAWRVDGAQPILVDVLGDGGGENTEQIDVLEYPQPSGAVWIDPTSLATPVDAPGSTPVTPPAPTPPFDPAPLLERLGGLESALAALTSTVEVLRSAIALPEPSREVVVTGRTDRAGYGPLSHSHSFSTKVVI